MKSLRTLIALLLLGLAPRNFANMASPTSPGSEGAFPLVSRHLDVLGEQLYLRIAPRMDSADVQATYHLLVPPDIQGRLPLLFIALGRSGQAGAMSVTYDGRPVLLDQTAQALEADDYFTSTGDIGRGPMVTVYFHPYVGYSYALDDLQHFVLDVTPGEHVVVVRYTAFPWNERGEWLLERSIQYSLSPARYWKSFGPLEVTIEAPRMDGTLSCSLGPPQEGSLPGRAIWRMDALSREDMHVTLVPTVRPIARTFMEIGPLGLSLIAFIILVAVHLRQMYRFRMKGRTDRSWLRIVGVILVPLIVLVGYVYTYPVIDALIGQGAAHYHGYVFMVPVILYPLLMPVYAVLCWSVDRAWRRKVFSLQG